MRDLLKKRILFFGGKGGVGKTTCASAMALAASRAGKRVLLVSTDPAHSTSDIFERPFSADEREILPGLVGMELDADLYIGVDDTIRNWVETTFSRDSGMPLVGVNHGTSEEPGVRELSALLARGIIWAFRRITQPSTAQTASPRRRAAPTRSRASAPIPKGLTPTRVRRSIKAKR